MLKDKLTIYSSPEDEKRVRELILGCVPDIELNMVRLTAVAPDANETDIVVTSDCRCVVIPYDFSLDTADSVRKLTYSDNGAKGDISGLNLQKRETCTCFELLYGVFMSRVYIPLSSVYTAPQVLMCICILCGWGASVEKVIPVVNEFLK